MWAMLDMLETVPYSHCIYFVSVMTSNKCFITWDWTSKEDFPGPLWSRVWPDLSIHVWWIAQRSSYNHATLFSTMCWESFLPSWLRRGQPETIHNEYRFKVKSKVNLLWHSRIPSMQDLNFPTAIKMIDLLAVLPYRFRMRLLNETKMRVEGTIGVEGLRNRVPVGKCSNQYSKVHVLNTHLLWPSKNIHWIHIFVLMEYWITHVDPLPLHCLPDEVQATRQWK